MACFFGMQKAQGAWVFIGIFSRDLPDAFCGARKHRPFGRQALDRGCNRFLEFPGFGESRASGKHLQEGPK